MYHDFFGLNEAPFSLSPDPRFMFMSERHREALAHMLYGVRGDGGFIVLTGEVGTGKTTVCRCLLAQLPMDCEVAFILNPRQSEAELLASICDELHIDYPVACASVKILVDRIFAHLLRVHGEGRRTVIIIDEAQNLSAEVLEQLRLLTNLETERRKLLQIILLGQPEFREMLAQPQLRQLAQRVTARYHLEPLSRAEAQAYIHHRLRVAGRAAGVQGIFSSSALNRIHRLSGGVPRLINLLCDRAMLGPYTREEMAVSATLLRQAAEEIAPVAAAGSGARRWAPLAVGLLAVVVAASAFMGGRYWVQPTPRLQAVLSAPGELAAPLAEAENREVRTAEVVEIVESQTVVDAGQGLPPSPAELATTERRAWQALLELWGIEAPSLQTDLCTWVENQGLRCLGDRGSLSVLAQLDQPAILSLAGRGPHQGFLVLAGLDGERATLHTPQGRQEIATASLSEYWLGEFIMLWRPPAGAPELVRPGERGTFVTWLATQLDRLEGRPDPGLGRDHYDAQLLEQVRRFQVREGLIPDGIVGSRTLIRLNAALGVAGPRLSEEGS